MMMTALAMPLPAQDAVVDETQGQERPPTMLDARDLRMSGYYDRALAAYRTLLEDDALRIPAGIGLAQTLQQTGQYEKAIETLEALDADHVSDWHFATATQIETLGRYDDALAHLRQAVNIDKGHTGARLEIARLLERAGKRDEAIEAYSWFNRLITGQPTLPDDVDAQWLTNVGAGFLRYSELTRTNVAARTRHVLREMWQVAYSRLDRTYWPAHIAAADLLRGKYNNSEDDGSVSDYQAALRINTNLPQAHVGLGHVALEQWAFEEVERRVNLALETNPSYAPAHRLLARCRILERRYEDAEDMIHGVLVMNPHDLSALSIMAAAQACRYDSESFEATARRVNAINPRCAVFHRIVGEALSGIRQYRDSERHLKAAIEYEPTDANARTELGMMYMQWGYEDKARDALDAAWELDPFNDRTKFTLELLESLEEFDEFESANFIVKYDSDTDPGIGRVIAEYLESIYQAVTSDYSTTLTEKTIIEVFPTHRAFGVRITGKPWIHTIGACTGRVIAIDAPRESVDLMGPYNLARVLKHEFTHTVTLAATDNRIPHWFTEGLAVLQEDAPRSFDWAKMLAEALRRDELFTIESINWGFIRPRGRMDRTQAYAQSEWMCEFIIERYGYDVIDKMLRAYREGKTQTEVLNDLLETSEAEFDTAFREWATREVVRWGFDLSPLENPIKLRAQTLLEGDNADIWGRLARAEFDAENMEAALDAARKALDLDENNVDGLEIASRVLVAASKAAPDRARQTPFEDEALPLLERLAEQDPDNWTAPSLLADIALRRNDLDAAETHLKQLQRVCPMDPASWRGLAGIYLKREQYDLALPQLLELVRTEEHDADVAMEIGRIYQRQGRMRDAIYWYQQGLYISPFSVLLNELLADASMIAGDTESALSAYRMLTKIEPSKAEHFADAAFAAKKMGKPDEARDFARSAVEIDAESPARTLLEGSSEE